MDSVYRPTLKSGKPSARYWVKYYVDGRAVRESTKTAHRDAAKRYLKTREGAVAVGAPIPPRMDRVRYEELAADLRAFYETTGRRRLAEVDDHLAHLKPFFNGRRVVAITPDVLTQYVARRQAEPTKVGHLPANRTINMELAVLKRMLRLGMKHGKVLRVPSIDFLKEAPPREGFFEADQFAAVRRRLAPDLRAAVTVAYTSAGGSGRRS